MPQHWGSDNLWESVICLSHQDIGHKNRVIGFSKYLYFPSYATQMSSCIFNTKFFSCLICIVYATQMFFIPSNHINIDSVLFNFTSPREMTQRHENVHSDRSSLLSLHCIFTAAITMLRNVGLESSRRTTHSNTTKKKHWTWWESIIIPIFGEYEFQTRVGYTEDPVSKQTDR